MTETTAGKLQDLITAKKNIRAAIESKGAAVTGGLSTYAAAIDRIKLKGDHTIDPNTRFSLSTFTDAPELDTSNYTSMNRMFATCLNLENVPVYKTENVTNMDYMFSQCGSLKQLDWLDTTSVKSMYGMFSPQLTDQITGETDTVKMSLERLPMLKCYNVEDVTSMFGYQGYGASMDKLTDIEGFEGLGKVGNLKGTNRGGFIYKCTALSDRSIKNIINSLYDRAAAGLTPLELYFNYIYHRIDDETKAVAANKGWIITL